MPPVKQFLQQHGNLFVDVKLPGGLSLVSERENKIKKGIKEKKEQRRRREKRGEEKG